MKRRNVAIVVAVVVVIAFAFLAPVVYLPTTVYGPLIMKTYPSYPNWESLSCWASGFGMYYGRTVFQTNASYQFGCAFATASLP